MTLDIFTRQYIITALWSSTDPDNNDKPLDDDFTLEDIDPETLKIMVADCIKFQQENADDINGEDSQAGYDFWLNRNGHGTGFWDGDWPEPAATRLDNASKAFGEFYLYVGDDDKIHGLKC